MMNIINKIMGLGGKTSEWRERIRVLEEKRLEQNKKLEELTRLTLDGEDEWLILAVRRGLKENPECAPTIINHCLRPTKDAK